MKTGIITSLSFTVLNLFSNHSFGQSDFGARYGAVFTDDKTMNTTSGVGLFFNSNDSSAKINFLMACDVFWKNNKRYEPENISITSQAINLSFTPLYLFR